MPTTKFYVLFVKDGPLRSCARLFLEDGTPLHGISSYACEPNFDRYRVILTFNNADMIHVVDAPPTRQYEFYSPTFPPGVRPARVGKYLATLPLSDDWFMLHWKGTRWCDSRGRLFANGQPYAWRGLAFDPLTAYS